MSETPNTITLELNEEETALITALARERGLSEPADALRALLHDALKFYDDLWDKKFADSRDVLERITDEGHAEHRAGLAEDFDVDEP
ncbi:MAG: hypothetical protein H7175_15130 [Burkholderiales bacterium]|nr:hypothetical protein [Anaerolineae bacterium]